MFAQLYADKDGLASEHSQAQYEFHVRKVVTAITVFSWFGFLVNILSALSTLNNTFWVREFDTISNLEWN